MPRGRVVVVEDEPAQRDVIRGYLSPLPIDIVCAGTTAEAVRLLDTEKYHAIISDLVMPGGGGLEIIRSSRRSNSQVPVIILTGYSDEETAEECMREGAFDFITKPVHRLALIAVLRRALLRSGLIFDEAASPPPPEPQATRRFPHLVGISQAIRSLHDRIAKVAESDTNICIYGESGTGKELVARAIHYLSRRSSRPLIVFDCAAIPEGLMESEMFGHVKGSFTSAVSDRDGVFQLADGGTLLLDEIGELSLPLQAKLLRVIQCREFRKVGGKHPIKVDTRIVAATNKNLHKMVTEGTFREDLYYRLEVIPILLPALRQRKEDIPLLANHFIERFNRNNRKQIRGVTPGTMGVLLKYDWPGNVRELENCIERAAVMADGDMLDVTEISQVLRPGSTAPVSASPAVETGPRSLKEAERELIVRTLQDVRGNRTRAAELLGISLRGLHYKLKELQQAGVQIPGNGNSE